MNLMPILFISFLFIFQPWVNFAAQEIPQAQFPEPFKREDKPQTFTCLVRYLPSKKAFWIDDIDIRTLLRSNQSGKISIKVLKLPDRTGVFDQQFSVTSAAEARWKNILLPYHPKDGYYEVEVTAQDESGLPLATELGRTQLSFLDLRTGRYRIADMLRNEHFKEWVKPYPVVQTEFLVQSYPFEDFSIKESDHPLPPFTKAKVSGDKVYILGRVYQFNGLALPKQIYAKQVEPTIGPADASLLAGDTELVVITEKEEVSIDSGAAPVLQEGRNGVAGEGKGSYGGLDIQTKVKIEEDGVIRVNLYVFPKQPTLLKGLSLRINLDQKQSTLFHELTDVRYRGIAAGGRLHGHAGILPVATNQDGIVWDSRNTEKKRIKGTFQPFIWLGNEDRGLCWFADNDKGWIGDDQKADILVSRKDDKVVLEVRFINKETTLNTPLEIEFGLLATPVKPLPKGWRSWVYPRWSTMDWKFYENLPHLRKIVMLGASVPPFNAGVQSAVSQNIEETRKMYADLRKRFSASDSYMEYWICDEQSLDAPEMRTYFGEWCGQNSNGRFTIWGKKYSDPSRSTFILQRGAKSYLDYKIWCLNEKLSDVGLMSFYEDNAMQRTMDDPALDLGYDRSDGTRQITFDMWSLRDYFRRMAAVYDAHGMENLIGVHKSTSTMIPAFTHAVFAIDGEQPTRMLDKPDTNALLTWDDFDYFRAHVMGRQFGLVPIFLSLIKVKNDTSEILGRSTMALCLLHDVPVWDGEMPERRAYRTWHRILNDFDFRQGVDSFFPYWGKKQAVISKTKDVVATAWQIQNRILLVVVNRSGKPFKDSLLIQTQLFTSQKDAEWILSDAETRQNVEFESDRATVEIRPWDYRVLELKNIHPLKTL